MNLILIRHGSKDQEKASQDEEMPLSDEGICETRKLGDMLSRLGIKPDRYPTSKYQHTSQMGNLLAKQLSGKTVPRVLGLVAFTSHSPSATFEEIINEAKRKGADLRQAKIVTIVGLEARLSQLLIRLTSARARPFIKHAEAACLTAPAIEDVLRGRGEPAGSR